MGFNLGAFAGGMSGGLETGSQMADQRELRRLRAAQLGQLNAGNQGQQAWVNSMIPGGQPMPQGAGGQQGIVPILSNMPIIGQLGRELGLWGDVPQQPAAQPMAGQPPRFDLGGQGQPQGGGMPQQPSQGAPQAPQPPAQAPSPSPMPVGQPAAQASPTSANAIAMAIDKANPGLRASNPAAFAQAVQMGIAHVQESEKAKLQSDLTRSQISGQDAENVYKGAQTQNLQGPQADLTRANTENIKSQTEVHKGEALLAPAKLKLEQAKQKHEELKANAAQAKMALDEAETNAKVGDFTSQRQWRDAQIANMRAERLLKAQDQKIKETKLGSEVDELKSRAKMNEQHGNLYESQAGVAGTSRAKDKEVNVALGKAQMQLRHYENMDRQLRQSMNPNDPRIKQLQQEIQPFIQENRARVQELESQLSTAKKAPEAQATPEIPAPRQQELSKVSAKVLEYANSNNKEGVAKLVQALKAKGIPEHEIQWALENARTMSNSAPTTPQVPMSR